MTARKQCGSGYVRVDGDGSLQLLAGRVDGGRSQLVAGPGRSDEQQPAAVRQGLGLVRVARRAPAGSAPGRRTGRRRAGRGPRASSTATSSVGRATGDLLAVEAWPGRSRHERRRHRRRRRGPRRPRPARLPHDAVGCGGQRRAAGLDLAQHVGGPLRVAVAQRLVVGHVDVAGGRARRRGRAASAAGSGAPPRARRGGPGSRIVGVSVVAGQRCGDEGAVLVVGVRRRRPRLAPPAAERHRQAGDARRRGRRPAAPTRARRARWPAARAGCARRSCDSMSAMISSSVRPGPRRRAR